MDEMDFKKMRDEKIIERIRQGDKEALDFIMNKYKSWVRKRARTLYLIGGENDDLIQEGMIGLFKAVQTYDLERDTSFSSFAQMCINYQMYTAITASRRLKHSPLNSYISLYKGFPDDSFNEPLTDILEDLDNGDPEAVIINRESLLRLSEAMEKNLSPFEKMVTKLYIDGMSYAQIAEALDKDVKSVDNALQRVKGKLMEILKNIE